MASDEGLVELVEPQDDGRINAVRATKSRRRRADAGATILTA
jgi:hypothetical protein